MEFEIYVKHYLCVNLKGVAAIQGRDIYILSENVTQQSLPIRLSSPNALFYNIKYNNNIIFNTLIY